MPDWEVMLGVLGAQPFKRILASFTKATGLRAAITDAEGEVVCAPEDLETAEFCRLVRCSSLGRFKCQRSYRLAGAESMKYSGPYIFRCHAGLVAWAAPVALDGQHLASVICGQVLMWEPEDFFWEEMEVMTRGLGVELDRLVAAARNLEVVSAQRVQAAAELVYLMANQLARTSSELRQHKQELEAREARLRSEIRAREEVERVLARLQARSAFMGFVARQEAFLQCVRAGQEEPAAAASEELLSEVLRLYPGDLRRVKVHAAELLVNMMRAAVEGGAPAEQALTACHDHMEAVGRMAPAQACQWLAAVARGFASMVRDGRCQEAAGVVARAAEFVRTNRTRRLTVSNIAQGLYLSPSGLAKLFRREVGCSVAQFILRVKVDEAKRLLTDPRFSVRQVAGSLGFEDSSYFAKVFRRLEGITPGEYRRRGGGEGARWATS